MPVAFKPGKSIPYILSGDRSDPEPPRFLVRALTGEQAQDLADTLDQLGPKAREEKKTGRQGIAAVYDAIRGAKLLNGWENLKDGEGQPVPFDPEKLESILSVGEARELIAVAISGLTEDDRKK